MTFTLTNNAEGGTNGTTVTTGNSGGGSGTAWDVIGIGSGAGLVFSNAFPAHGSLGYKFTTGVTSVADTLRWTTSITGSPTTLWVRGNFYFPSLPPVATGAVRLIRIQDGSNNDICSLSVLTSGAIRLFDALGTQQATSATTVPTGQQFRLELEVVSGVATGQIICRIYTTNCDDLSPDETLTTVATLDTNGANIGLAEFGVCTGGANLTFYGDDLAISTVGWIGPAGVGTSAEVGSGALSLVAATSGQTLKFAGIASGALSFVGGTTAAAALKFPTTTPGSLLSFLAAAQPNTGIIAQASAALSITGLATSTNNFGFASLVFDNISTATIALDPITFLPPTIASGWPTGQPLIDRLKIDRGVSVITDGHGGWTATQFPWQGTIQDLIEGTDYFLGGHIYQITEAVYESLLAAGMISAPPLPPPPSDEPSAYGAGIYGDGPYGGTGG